MKFKITLFCFLMTSVHYHCADLAFLSQDSKIITVGVPTKFLAGQSSLMIYMIDHQGNQSVGTCNLDSKCFSQDKADVLVLQNELNIKTVQEDSNEFNVLADLMNIQPVEKDLVMLHFEFDHAVRILKILVVKNSFLEEDPFNVYEVPFKKTNDLIEDPSDDDFFSSLFQDVDPEGLDAEIEKKEKIPFLKKITMYAEIYMMMQYSRVKRTVVSWLAN